MKKLAGALAVAAMMAAMTAAAGPSAAPPDARAYIIAPADDHTGVVTLAHANPLQRLRHGYIANVPVLAKANCEVSVGLR